jgi:hypothetical protein
VSPRAAALLAACAGAGALLSPAAHADGGFAAVGAGRGGFETRCDGDACDRRDTGFRVALGWEAASHWTVEAVYLHPGRFVAGDVTSSGTPFHGRAELTGWGATAGYALPAGPVVLSARAGLASLKADFTPGPAPASAGGRTTTQFLAGLGARWAVAPHVALRVDWDHSRARINRFAGDVNLVSVGLQFGF